MKIKLLAPTLSNFSQIAHLKIEFSNSEEFNEIVYVLNTLDQTTFTFTNESNTNKTIDNLKIFTGLEEIGFPIDGIGCIFSDEQVCFEKSEIPGKYYRFKWSIFDDTLSNNPIKVLDYVFGSIDS